MSIKPEYIPRYTLLFIALVYIFVFGNVRTMPGAYRHIVQSDAIGYYSYLPAAFIYHDANFAFRHAIEVKYKQGAYYNQDIDGHEINKYFVGTAIAELPFFIVGHLAAQMLGYDIDGFSLPYIYAVNFAAIFYMLAGLWLISKTLIKLGTSYWNVAIVLLTFAFGTHLFIYTEIEPGMSHAYSFFFISSFIYFFILWTNTYQNRFLYWVAISIGMTVLIRPINLLVIFSIPFLCGNINRLKESIYYLIKHYKLTLIAALISLSIISIQLIYYKLATGSFIVYSYKKEGFQFYEFNLFKFLFSYKKGFFLYTPILFIALLASLIYIRDSAYKLGTYLGFMLVVTYILSCWWLWYYGGSFSARTMVEYIPMFAFPFAALLEALKPRAIKGSMIALLTLLVILAQVQMYQYRYYIIHWSDMNEQLYWEHFLELPK